MGRHYGCDVLTQPVEEDSIFPGLMNLTSFVSGFSASGKSRDMCKARKQTPIMDLLSSDFASASCSVSDEKESSRITDGVDTSNTLLMVAKLDNRPKFTSFLILTSGKLCDR